jgi:excisionase family DNA binding protein
MMDKLLTPEQVAERLVVTPRVVKEWLRQGKLKGVKVGKMWRVYESDLEAFLRPSNREAHSE